MFKLFLVTPESKIVADQDLEALTIPAHKGQLNILPGHASLTTTLEPGILTYKLKGSEEQVRFAISWGYCQVTPESVQVLIENATSKKEVDLDLAKRSLAEEDSKLLNVELDNKSWDKTQKQIARLRAEIELKESH
jgi:F-type H+-transporting ATPase subunit epsilon